jgi:hypothetical protein
LVIFNIVNSGKKNLRLPQFIVEDMPCQFNPYNWRFAVSRQDRNLLKHSIGMRNKTTYSVSMWKGKDHPIPGHQGPRGGVEVYLYSLSTSALDEGGCSVPRPGRFTPGKDPVPIVQEAGWAPGPVWTCSKNLAPTGIRSPNRPARTHSYQCVMSQNNII